MSNYALDITFWNPVICRSVHRLYRNIQDFLHPKAFEPDPAASDETNAAAEKEYNETLPNTDCTQFSAAMNSYRTSSWRRYNSYEELYAEVARIEQDAIERRGKHAETTGSPAANE